MITTRNASTHRAVINVNVKRAFGTPYQTIHTDFYAAMISTNALRTMFAVMEPFV